MVLLTLVLLSPTLAVVTVVIGTHFGTRGIVSVWVGSGIAISVMIVIRTRPPARPHPTSIGLALLYWLALALAALASPTIYLGRRLKAQSNVGVGAILIGAALGFAGLVVAAFVAVTMAFGALTG